MAVTLALRFTASAPRTVIPFTGGRVAGCRAGLRTAGVTNLAGHLLRFGALAGVRDRADAPSTPSASSRIAGSRLRPAVVAPAGLRRRTRTRDNFRAVIPGRALRAARIVRFRR